MGTRPAYTAMNHGSVISIIVEPASAPTPTWMLFAAFAPMPEKSTMAPSGTAPKIGRTTEPTSPSPTKKRQRQIMCELQIEEEHLLSNQQILRV